jgi:signal transduction histidine kinase
VFKSSLVKRTLFLAVSLLTLQVVVVYFYVLPLNRDHNYQLMEKHGKEVLLRISGIVDSYYNEIVSHRKDTVKKRKEEVQNMVKMSLSFLEELYETSKKGGVSKEEAQKLAINFFNSFRYRNNNYIWVLSNQGGMISHPMKQNSEKVQLDNEEIETLNKLVFLGNEKGKGFHNYQWRRAGGFEKKTKLSYFELFSEWGWIIGTGIYIDDIDKEMEMRKQELSREIQKIVQTIKIGETGYIYIFDEKHNMLFHPNRYLLGEKFKYFMNPNTHKTMGQSLQDAYYSPSKTLFYNWDHPNDKKNFVYQKVSWVEYHKGLKWYIGSSAYLQELNKGSDTVRHVLLFSSFFIGSLLLIFLTYVIRDILLPIGKLSKSAQKVSNGDYSVQVKLKSVDEVGQLANYFDKMVVSIKDNLKEQKQLSEAKLSAVTELIGLIAHHWRQPLTVISTSVYDIVEAYEYDELSDEYLDERYEYINKMLQDMSQMIDQFRLIFKPEAEKKVFSICSSILNVIKQNYGVCDNGKIEVKINEVNTQFFSCAEKINIDGYSSEFEKMIDIFFQNAIEVVSKVEEKEKYIHIEISEDINLIRIVIKDSGGGIPEDLQEKIFQPYFTTKHQAFGTGLSLYMAKMIIEMNMNGKLSVENTKNGAKFTIELRKV